MSNRYEDEIRKLLESMDDFMPEEPRTRRAPRRPPGLSDRIRSRLRSFSTRWRGFNLGRRFVGVRSSAQLVLVGMLLVVVAVFLRMLPVIGVLSGFVGAIGVLLFLVGYVLSFLDIGRPKQEARWRGRIIEMPRRRPWWLEILRRVTGRRY